MKLSRMRILSVATSIAFVAAAAGAASLASAATGGPTVTLTSSCSTAASTTPITVTATFSENIGSFGSSSVTVTNGTAGNFATSTADTVFTFDVTPTADGDVTVQVPADAVMSASTTPTGNQASNTLTCDYDTMAPAISGVSVSGVSDTAATISWTTDEPTTGLLSLGTTTSYGTSATTSLSTSHSVSVTGLSASTTYNYQIMATDAAGNSTSTANATFATNAAPLAPVISGISVTNVGTTTATISWSTDVAAAGFVSYGTTTSYGATTTTESTASTTHSVTLSGLSEATLYHFQISQANSGGTATSTDQTFMTLSTASSTPLAVTSTDTVQSSGIADNVFADGWKWTLHFTVPDTEDAFRIRFSDWGNASTSFPANGNIRVSSPQSSNASTTSSGFIATGNGYSDWIYLTGDTATSTAGRQIDLTVEVKIPFGTPTGSYSSTFTAQTYPSSATSTAP